MAAMQDRHGAAEAKSWTFPRRPGGGLAPPAPPAAMRAWPCADVGALLRAGCRPRHAGHAPLREAEPDAGSMGGDGRCRRAVGLLSAVGCLCGLAVATTLVLSTARQLRHTENLAIVSNIAMAESPAHEVWSARWHWKAEEHALARKIGNMTRAMLRTVLPGSGRKTSVVSQLRRRAVSDLEGMRWQRGRGGDDEGSEKRGVTPRQDARLHGGRGTAVWEFHRGVLCRHNSSDDVRLGGRAAGTRSSARCKAACAGEPTCVAASVLHGQEASGCTLHRRGALSQCTPNESWDLWLRARANTSARTTTSSPTTTRTTVSSRAPTSTRKATSTRTATDARANASSRTTTTARAAMRSRPAPALLALTTTPAAGPPQDPPLFCFVVVRTDSYELALMQALYPKRQSIFGCNSWRVFSDLAAPLGAAGGPPHSVALSVPPSPVGHVPQNPSWKMLLNTDWFFRAWDTILRERSYGGSEWVVKIDPDTVFFPDRLRERLRAKHIAPGASTWFKNCRKFKSMQGPLEIFSRAAVDVLSAGMVRCKQAIDTGGIGEDWFMGECMDLLGIPGTSDFGLLSDKYCEGALPCTSRSLVAFHPYKAVDLYLQCVG
eukprot:CAMPEP_0179329804 /NCGR_PEP_ID=MMETSP0797-20121207/63325_1 /TAXON_ID=47934 /ORGANISM="Dinophysis acuminata, Strain DAEP01" /LENGTH=603 /DNA_ID=CAMNT_0021042489 /DNA_START=29 /DNA_END=1837 /DNA_ORIENTATION=+